MEGERERERVRKGRREVRDGVNQGAWEIVSKGGGCHNHTCTHTYISTTHIHTFACRKLHAHTHTHIDTCFLFQ